MKDKKTILHIISGLGDGGAEGVLYRLCCNDSANQHTVISFLHADKYSQPLENAGVSVIHLNLVRGRIHIRDVFKLYKVIKNINPDIVQTWMYHSDLLGGTLAKLCGVSKVFWNVRHSDLDISKTKRSTVYIAKLCAAFSRFIPAKVICCAEQAKQEHIRIGYLSKKMIVIENGYDLSRFQRIQTGALPLLNEKFKLLSSKERPLIGMVGRYTAEKDHNNLFHALHLLDIKDCDFFLVLAGNGVDYDNKNLLDLIDHYKLNNKVMLLGPVLDIPSLMNHLDFHILSSSSEGFPNVLAEAMACGTPCISTMAGAAERIIGDTGWLVPISSPEKLADAIQDAILEFEQHNEKWNERRMIAEQRIKDNFSIDVMVDKYNEVWSS